MSSMRRDRPFSQWPLSIFLLLAGLALVVVVTWSFPALTLASQTLLFRIRGAFVPSQEIVVLAIDDHSMREIGPWPWPRTVMAEVIDRLSKSQPRAIGIDVIYAEATTEGPERVADARLAEAIARSGRVVLPARLYETPSGTAPSSIEWLRPASPFAEGAAGVGHVHVAPGVDGMVRTIQLSKANDRGEQIWAFGLEVIRLAEGIGSGAIDERPDSLHVGGYQIPVLSAPGDDVSANQPRGVTRLRANEMLINFAGGSGTFPTLSIVDLLGNRLAPDLFRDRIVLIGTTAPSMGDSRIVPFMHYGQDAAQGGREMPGVEIHANVINTIRSRLFVRPVSEGAAFLAALLTMLLTMLLIRRLDGWRLMGALGLLLLAMLGGSYLAFSRLLVMPPLVPMLTGFGIVIPLLISRSLEVSRQLDHRLAALAESQEGLLPDPSAIRTVRSRTSADAPAPLQLPRGFEWKLRTVENLTHRLLARMGFIQRVLTSMGEGVIVTDLEGRIILANAMADRLFEMEEEGLVGQPLIELLRQTGRVRRGSLTSAIEKALGQESLQLDFTFESATPRHYSLFLSALVAESNGQPGTVESPPQVRGLVVLISDITKRVELDRMKTETLQLVSHELRTPLHSIHALSDVLLRFPVSEGESREMLSTIHTEARRLAETIHDYLDLNRLESGARPLQLAPTDLRALIGDCCRSLSPLASQKEIRLVEDLDPELTSQRVDANLLTHAITNLLSNAIKYSPTGTEVTIQATPESEGTTIRVRDQGYGIPEEAQQRVFEKFYRLERDQSAGAIGSGLGLALVKEIIERHSGTIEIVTPASGGTEFRLFLPLAVHRRHSRF